jgi:uncharacterized membrane protein YjgN (DUF898 family)
MEIQPAEKKDFTLSFNGQGSTFFGIVIVNWLLSALTLGIYYPWAKAKQLKFMYSSTVFNNDQFVFHGTGKEMFIGMLKTLLIVFVLMSVYLGLILIDQLILGVIILYLMLFAFLPLAIHGSYRYRMSRTSWRGIRFGYRGDKMEFFGNFVKWIFLTIITLGIYSAWMSVKMRSYVYGNIRAGNTEFKYEASGLELFIIILKGYFLTIITLGIYMFWWQKELFEFQINNMSLNQGDKKISFKSAATAGGFFKLVVLNILILVFTLGLGFAWVEVRNMRFICDNIKLNGDIDMDRISQTEENYTDAVGEEMADFFDIDLVL